MGCAGQVIKHLTSIFSYREKNRYRTPLHYACMGHRVASTKWLIKHKARINIQDHDGDTPLLAALKEAVRGERVTGSHLLLLHPPPSPAPPPSSSCSSCSSSSFLFLLLLHPPPAPPPSSSCSSAPPPLILSGASWAEPLLMAAQTTTHYNICMKNSLRKTKKIDNWPHVCMKLGKPGNVLKSLFNFEGTDGGVPIILHT